MSVSSRSRVAPTSRIDFTPAQTTVMPVAASVVRSADSSQLSRASRCTPPRPPVANTRMPARAARCEVEATVVAAEPPRATTGGEVAHARLHEARRRARAPRARRRPGRSAARRRRPRSWPGTAPSARTAASSSRATSRLRPRGSPWAIRVLSRATTGRAVPRAPRRRRRRCASPAILGSWPLGALFARLAGITLASRWARTRSPRSRQGSEHAGGRSILIAGQAVLLAAALIAAVVADGRGRLAALEPVLRAARPGHPRASSSRCPPAACTSARPSSPPRRPWRCSAPRPRR